MKQENLLFKLCFHNLNNNADNIGSKKVIMTNNMVRKKSKCANFVAEKLRLLKQK